MLSILRCSKTTKFFVAKYIFLQQNKIWDEPLCNGHLSIAGHFFTGPMVSAIERFHCISKSKKKSDTDVTTIIYDLIFNFPGFHGFQVRWRHHLADNGTSLNQIKAK